MADDSETSMKIYLQEIMQTPLLTAQEEIELAARIKKGDQKARAWMIKANLRLVVKIAHDYSNFGLPFLDLISEGNIGLIKAVERFDPGKGGKLSTYSAWWIKQSIKRALANQSKMIRLPVHLVDKIWKMRRVSLQMSEELGREPTDEEFAEEIGISSVKLSQLKSVSIRPASLDAPISDDDSTEFGEIVGDEDARTPFELFRDKNMRDELSELLEVLDDRERKIIFERYGLGTHGFFAKEDPTGAKTEAQASLNVRQSVIKSKFFKNPMHRSGLALAGAQTTMEAWKRDEVPSVENDGILTAEDVSTLDLQGTWVVTLSACDTGSGEARAGEGVMGLRRGFIQAGAQNLLMTLWPISDEVTAQIMSDFYDAAHNSGNAPEALAEVQRNWLVKLRTDKGLAESVRLAGPFIMSSQGKPIW